jgi:outer membrane protein assembly factor BamB
MSPSRPANDDLFEDDDDFEEVDELEEIPSQRQEPSDSERPRRRSRREREPEGTGFLARLRAKAVRPGEQDLVRSPFAIGLGTGALILLLASVTIWLIIGRTRSRQLYDLAQEEMKAGKYTQSIRLFKEFLDKYPRNNLAPEAKANLWRSQILTEIDGGVPAWEKGVKRLEEFIVEYREHPDFKNLQKDIREYSKQIALGTAADAEKNRTRALLPVAKNARRILERYPPKKGTSEKLRKQIRTAYENAEAAIVKQEKLDETIASVAKSLKAGNTQEALATRLRLLARYPELEGEKTLGKTLPQILKSERELVARTEPNRDALTTEQRVGLPLAATIAFHSRPRSDGDSDGRAAFIVAKDCCYGIDAVTGRPLWRRVIGRDTPFSPLPVSTVRGTQVVETLLLFESASQNLSLVELRSGKLLWRQPLGERPSGPPRLHEGQIYLATASRHLFAIEVESGRIVTRLEFPQAVLGPPALVGETDRLVIAGEQGVCYTLSIRPLECSRVSYTGHQPSSIESPLVEMGPLLLIAENADRSCLLRVIDASAESGRVRQVASYSLKGQVRDRAIIRGKDLFVPFEAEQLAAFTVTNPDDVADSDETTALAFVDAHAEKEPVSTPIFLTAGSDGQLWMASTALRKLRLTSRKIQTEPASAAPGEFTQPLQSSGNDFFIARKLPLGGAVFFSHAARSNLEGNWSTVLGAKILATIPADSGSFVCVTEGGSVFRVQQSQLVSGAFLTKESDLIDLPENTSTVLKATALGNGQIAVWIGGKQPTLWTVNKLGLVDRMWKLEEELQTAPVLLSAGIVLPYRGRIAIQRIQPGAAPVRDFRAAAGGEEPPRWRQLLALDETRLVAVDSLGRMSGVRYVTTSVPELSQIRSIEFGQPIDGPVTLANGKLAVADAGRRLQIFNASNLESSGEVALEAAATNAPWIIADRLYVETGRNTLNCYRLALKGKPIWSIPLGGASLSGAPLHIGEALIVATIDGRVRLTDVATGKILRTADAGQALVSGPRKVGSLHLVPTSDGSLYRLDSLLGSGAGK